MSALRVRPTDSSATTRATSTEPTAEQSTGSTAALAQAPVTTGDAFVEGPQKSRGLIGELAYRFYGSMKQQPGRLALQAEPTPIAPIASQLTSSIRQESIEAHVRFLADPALAGRNNGTAGAEEARRYVEGQFKDIGLKPVFGDSFRQNVVAKGNPAYGVNVAGYLPATKPNPKGEYVAVIAHLDHTGVQKGKAHLGADDNASGVAAMIEAARGLSQVPGERAYDIVFLAPDTEEPPDIRTERMGSSYFVDHGPREKEALKLAIVLDVVGNDNMDTRDKAATKRFMVLGAETSPQVAALVNRTPDAAGTKALRMSVAMIEKFLLPWQRNSKSDYHGVRASAERPFVMLTAGTSPRYHTPEDVPGSVDYAKIEVIADYMARLALAAADDVQPYNFDGDSVDPAADLAQLDTLLEHFLARPPENLRPAMRSKLEKNVWRLAELQYELDTKGKLSSAHYSALQGIAVDLQQAATRPNLSKLDIAWQALWDRH